MQPAPTPPSRHPCKRLVLRSFALMPHESSCCAALLSAASPAMASRSARQQHNTRPSAPPDPAAQGTLQATCCMQHAKRSMQKTPEHCLVGALPHRLPRRPSRRRRPASAAGPAPAPARPPPPLPLCCAASPHHWPTWATRQDALSPSQLLQCFSAQESCLQGFWPLCCLHAQLWQGVMLCMRPMFSTKSKQSGCTTSSSRGQAHTAAA
jgi:hypothetical protein